MTSYKRGRIYVIEGIDSSGKTTLCKLIQEKLQQNDIRVQVFHFPGKDMDSLGKLVYQIHHNPKMFSKELPSLALQTLHVAAHIDLWLNYINDAVANGVIIMLDRFWWSTYAYGKHNSLTQANLIRLIDIEKSCYNNDDVSHFFYITRENSKDHNECLNNYYLELTQMKEHIQKTTIVKNDFAIEFAFQTIFNHIYSDIYKK